MAAGYCYAFLFVAVIVVVVVAAVLGFGGPRSDAVKSSPATARQREWTLRRSVTTAGASVLRAPRSAWASDRQGQTTCSTGAHELGAPSWRSTTGTPRRRPRPTPRGAPRPTPRCTRFSVVALEGRSPVAACSRWTPEGFFGRLVGSDGRTPTSSWSGRTSTGRSRSTAPTAVRLRRPPPADDGDC